MTSESEEKALQIIDQWTAAFNARDAEAFASYLHYPHVRFANGEVTIVKDSAAMAKSIRLVFAKLEGVAWEHTIMDSKQVIQSSDDKVHITLQATRYAAKGNKIHVFQTLYVVTLKADRWGIQARSSFAPLLC